MNTVIEYLQQLELSETEAKLYVALLEHEAMHVRDLAKAVGIKRTTAYLYVDSLIEKGLLTKIIKGSQKFVAATQPKDSLKYLVERNLEKAKHIKEEFPNMIQTINNSLPKFKHINDSEIQYFKGLQNVRKIYEEALSGNEIRSYVKVEEIPKISSDNPAFFNDAFKKNKQLKMWEIIYESPYSRRQVIKLLSQNNNGYFCKFMPKELKWSITSEDILIYDGKVALINYAGKVSSIILQSPDFYHNSKELFDFIWRLTPEVN